MSARDTISDFVGYRTKKEEFIRSGLGIFAPGEDDLLAYYLQSADHKGEHFFNFPEGEDCRLVCIAEGEWAALKASQEWKAREVAYRVSYVWDRIIELFNSYIIGGTSPVYPEFPFSSQELAVRALAAQNRLIRRELANALGEFLHARRPGHLVARVVQPLRLNCPYFIFITLAFEDGQDRDEYRQVRRQVMYDYCLAVKRKYPDAEEVVVIATEPHGVELSSEDVMYLDLRDLTPDQEVAADTAHTKLGYLGKLGTPKRVKVHNYLTDSLTRYTEGRRSLHPSKPRSARNSLCPCGSGKKFKRCCMRR